MTEGDGDVRRRGVDPESMTLHDRAVARGEDGYVDPTSGLFVLTAHYLARRPCCGNGCRHCPWEAQDDS